MKTIAFPMIALLVLAASSSRAARLSRRMFSGICDVIPVDGCSCHETYRGMDVSCHDLDLTTMPAFSSGEQISLESVHVTDNTIARLDGRAFWNVQIRKLYLRNNELSIIVSDAFSSSSDSLIHLDLSYNKLIEIPEALKALNVLRTIVLTNNDITSVSCDFAINRPYKSLYIDENPIEQFVWSACEWPLQPTGLTKLVISLDHVDNIDQSEIPFLVIPRSFTGNLAVFVVRQTRLAVVGVRLAHFSSHLRFVALEDAGLGNSEVNQAASFRTVSDILLGLSLSGNELTEVPHIPLRPMVNLELLDLSRNDITRIEFPMTYLIRLKNLDLSNNAINFISSGALQLPSLQILDLSNNALEGLALHRTESSNLLSLSVKGNPWRCDCDLKWFIQWVQDDAFEGEGPFISAEMFGNSIGQGLRCSTGGQFSDVLLIDINLGDFQC